MTPRTDSWWTSNTGSSQPQANELRPPHAGIPILHEALRYAAAGFGLLPLYGIEPSSRRWEFVCDCSEGSACSRAGRHPIEALVAAGAAEATTDSQTLREWWTAHPRANIGLATGVSGWDVIHADGVVGVRMLRMILSEGWLIDGPYRLMRGGGNGAWIFLPSLHADAGSTLERSSTGLGYHGFGSYACLPPSLHCSGEPYRWHRSGPPLDRKGLISNLRAID